eukprot:TRINITY_DN4828_c1_g1_i1.p2 TRINITY_DN4828_c1_g1~~TRINITY_DN4828_c1_g1_i1.p2  ORF type:complete len:113 (+),score=8.87 TRINITY_DN4828_c1_g1_i1:218-556(+)
MVMQIQIYTSQIVVVLLSVGKTHSPGFCIVAPTETFGADRKQTFKNHRSVLEMRLPRSRIDSVPTHILGNMKRSSNSSCSNQSPSLCISFVLSSVVVLAIVLCSCMQANDKR